VISTLDLGCPTAAARLGQELEGVGIVRVCGDPAIGLLDDFRPLQRAFFALPLQDKLELRWTGRPPVQGYLAFATERLDETAHPDAKECFNVNNRRFEIDGHSFVVPMHLWPQALPAMRAATQSLTLALDTLSDRIFRLLARHLGLSEEFFTSRHRLDTQTLRLLHYPVGSGQPGAGEHQDHSTLTLLDFDQPGLEADIGGWVDVKPVAGTLLVFSGDMMRQWTGGRTRSVRHRVRAPDQPRDALAWFCQAVDDVLLTGIDADAPTMTASEFMRRRATARYQRYLNGR